MAANPQAAFELLAGPLLVLIGFALILFGVFSAQCYFYWFTYEKDPRLMRYAVLVLWIFEACHTSFCLHIAYSYFVTHFGDPVGGVEHVVWSAGLTVMLEMVIVFISESFYIYRIYRLSHSILVSALPAVFLIPRLVLGFVVAAYLYVYDTWEGFRSHSVSENILNTSLSLGVATDITITGLLIYYLRHRRSQTSRTRHVIERLQRNIVNNGLLAVVLSIIILVTLHTVPNSLVFAGLVEIISKLYANSMIATLNARQSIKQSSDALKKDGFNSIQLLSIQDAQTQINMSDAARDVFTHTSATQSVDNYDQKTSNISISKTHETFVV